MTKYTGLTKGRYYIGTKDIEFDHTIVYDNGVRIPYDNDKFRIAPHDCILMCIEGGSAGRKIAFTNQDVCFGNKLCCFVSYGIDYLFLYYFLQSPIFQTAFKESTTGIIGGVSVNVLKNLLLPVPPLKEQNRIVKKLEELMPSIIKYDKAETQLATLNADFPELLKKSILQEAVQGKLVPQDPNDEPASVLLERIRAEKQKLIKAGKIKKDKHESIIITSDKIPYIIPENWVWCKIGKIFNLQAGKNIASDKIYNKKAEGRYPCYGGNGLRGYVEEYNREGYFVLIGRQGALCGNINFATEKFYATEHAIVVDTFANTDVNWCGIFLYALNLNQYATATAQPGLAVKSINEVYIPLPPLDEQKRIVAKMQELMGFYDKLKLNDQ